MISKAWLGTGEEAVTVGCVHALEREHDVVAPMIRNAGALHEMGMPLEDVFHGALATNRSTTAGRDGHFGDLARGVLQPISHVGDMVPVVTGMPTDRRELLLTTVLDAVPDRRKKQPGPSIWPLLGALSVGVLFILSIWTPWGVVVGSALLLPAVLMWGWPRRSWSGPFSAEEPS